MEPTIIVGLLSLAGTLGGSLLGILTANKLAIYRIEQLEKKVEKHNNVMERTIIVERDVKTICNRIDTLCEDVSELRKG